MAALATGAARLQFGSGINRRVAPSTGIARGSQRLNGLLNAKKSAGLARGARAASAAVAQAQSTSTAAGTIPVSFVVPECRLAFGEGLRLVGSGAEMGSWVLESGAVLTWQEGDNWSTQLSLPAGQYTFKLVITKADGGSYWEEGDDRKLSVAGTPGGVPISVTARFGDTASTAVAGAAEVAPAALQVSAAAKANSAAALPGSGRSGSGAGAGASGSGSTAASNSSGGGAAAADSAGTSRAAQLLAKAAKAAKEQPAVAAEAEQLQAAVDAAAVRVADLDRRKEALAAKLDNLQAEMEVKLKVEPSKGRSPSPPPPPPTARSSSSAPQQAARPAAAARAPAAAAQRPSSSPASLNRARSTSPAITPTEVPTGWLFRAPDADRAYGVSSSSSGGSSTAITLALLPILLPLCAAIYMSIATAFPELHLPPLPVKQVQAQLEQLQSSLLPSASSALGERLSALQQAGASQLAAAQQAGSSGFASLQQAAAQQAASLQEAGKGAVSAASDAAGQASQAASKQLAAAAESAKQVQGQLPASK